MDRDNGVTFKIVNMQVIDIKERPPATRTIDLLLIFCVQRTTTTGSLQRAYYYLMLSRMRYCQPYLKTALHSAAIISVRSFGTSTYQPLSSAFIAPSSSFTSRSSRFSAHHTTGRLFSSRAKINNVKDEEEDIEDGEDTEAGSGSNQSQEFASSYHAPVMYNECIDALLKRSHNTSFNKKNKYPKQSKTATDGENAEEDSSRPRIFIDGTLGGGGHSSCLLQNLSPMDILIGCDVDPSALATASTRLEEYLVKTSNDGNGNAEVGDNDEAKPIFIPVQSNFSDLEGNLRNLKHPRTGELLFFDDEGTFVGVDGILLDLGISSHQIDKAERGFAFMKDGPLDMRMWGGEWDNQANVQDGDTAGDFHFVANKNEASGGITAAHICNEFTQEEIQRILKVYGDEPRARKIAQSIVDARPLSTTGDLKEAVAMVTPEFAKKGRRMGRTATLARVFQALRIVVNEEDAVLRDAFEGMAPALIRKGGRLVVLAYHSMEDRASKRVMRDGLVDGSRSRGGTQRDMYGNEIIETEGKNARPWKALGKKQKATAEEVEVNPRARSATLRVAERL